MAGSEKRSEIPPELRDKLKMFDNSLTTLENKFEPLLKVPHVELNAQMTPMDKAKLDLVAAYSINSLFWMYLNVCGINPKEHGIKQELERIRSYMNRVKEIQDKEKAPKVDAKASKRFVKNALWHAAQNKAAQPETSPSTEASVSGEVNDSTELVTGAEGQTPSRKGEKRKSQDKIKHKGKKKSKSGRYMDT